MKVKYLLLSLLACAGFAVTSCTEEDPIFGGDELALKVEPSIISVGKDGGSKTIDINAGIEWKAEPKDSWITVSPSSGSGAGKVTVTVAKNDSEDARQTTVAVTAGTAKMNITVKQDAGGVVYGTAEHPYTPSRVYAYLSTLSDGEKTDDIYIEGFIAKIDEQFGTQYGNATFYMTDDGKTEAKMFQVYRALYIGNKKYDNPADKNINVGDKVVVYGKCVNYKGNTPETSSGEAYVVSIEEGTMPVLEMAEKSKAISAGDTTAEFDLTVKNLTAKWTVTPKETYAWVKDYTKEGTESGKITITVEANTADDAREAKFTVASDGAQSLEFTLTQNGNVLPANIGELIAAIPATATGSSTKAPFEANLKEAAVVTYVNGGTAYIEDATGAVILFNNNHGLKAGDTVKGKITGDCYWYNGAPEILGLGEAYEKGEGAAPAPKEITIPELLANYSANLIRFVVIKGVTVTDAIADGDRNGKVAVGSDEIAVYAQLKEQGLTLNKDAEGNLTAIVGCYNDNKQLLFWDNAWFEKTGGPVEVPEVYLNEFDCQNKKIEIYNGTDAEVDMTGWVILKNDGEEGAKDTFEIPAALAKVPAKGFAVFTCKQSDAANGPLFGLSGTKGFKIALMLGTAVVDVVDNLTTITEIPDGKSWGRETDGAENFVLFDTPTIGASNGTPATPEYTVSEIIAKEDNTEGIVKESLTVAKTTKAIVVSDGTKAVYVYDNAVADVAVGAKVVFYAKKTTYNGVPELTGVKDLDVKSTGNTVTYPDAKDITAEVATYAGTEAEYVSLTGTLAKSGNYYNMAIDGTEAKVGSIVNPTADLNVDSFDGKKITVTGYFNGLSGQGKYVNIIATKIEEVQGVEYTPTIAASDITNVAAEGVTDATTTVTFTNAEGWTASVTPDGTVVTAASIDGTTIKYTVAANTATEARDGKITVALKKSGKDDVTKEIKVSQKGAEAAGTVSITWVRSGGVDTVSDGYELYFPDPNYPEPKDNEYYQDKGTADSKVNTFTLQTKDRAVPAFSGEPTSMTLTVRLRGGSAKDPMTYPLYACLVDASGNNIESTVTTVVTALTNVFTDYTVTIPVTGVNEAYGLKLYHTKESSWNIRYQAITWTFVPGEAAPDTGSGIPDYDPITGFTW